MAQTHLKKVYSSIAESEWVSFAWEQPTGPNTYSREGSCCKVQGIWAFDVLECRVYDDWSHQQRKLTAIAEGGVVAAAPLGSHLGVRIQVSYINLRTTGRNFYWNWCYTDVMLIWTGLFSMYVRAFSLFRLKNNRGRWVQWYPKEEKGPFWSAFAFTGSSTKCRFKIGPNVCMRTKSEQLLRVIKK